jgi:hypothetical protein
MGKFRELFRVKAGKGSDSVLTSMPLLPPAQPAETHNLAVGASDRVKLDCVCAIHDKPYQMVFEREASGRYRWVASIKLIEQGARSGSGRGGAAALQDILVEHLPSETPCAWCGNSSFHHCRCNSLVCGGRMRGETFVCRTSCGAEWIGVPLRQVQGNKEEARPSRASAPTGGPALPTLRPSRTGETLAADNSSRALIIRK